MEKETEDLFNDGLDHIFVEMQDPVLDVFDDGMNDLFSSIEEPFKDVFDDGMDELFLKLDEPTGDDTNVEHEKKDTKALDIPPFFLSPENDTMPQSRQLFPGPAGLVITSDKPDIFMSPAVNNTSKRRSSIKQIQPLLKPEISSNQNPSSSITEYDSGKVFQDNNKAWLGLMKELKLKIKEQDCILHLFNINWIKTYAKKFPDNENIPFIAGVLEHSLSENLVVRNTLKITDHTGSMFVFLDDSFLEAFKEISVSGTCLILRNCRLYREKSRNQTFLLVLKKNVWFIATMKEIKPIPVEFTDPVSGKQFPCTRLIRNDINLLQNGPWKPEMLLEEYNDIMNAMKRDDATRVNETMDKIAVSDDEEDAFARAINEIDFDQFENSI